ncbi:MAG TPA: hypothetical protein PK167_14425, partial [Prolixibacteraceae bacterium]|nr:hypothetical protein [Prolixibacteraceae bacterium]
SYCWQVDLHQSLLPLPINCVEFTNYFPKNYQLFLTTLPIGKTFVAAFTPINPLSTSRTTASLKLIE